MRTKSLHTCWRVKDGCLFASIISVVINGRLTGKGFPITKIKHSLYHRYNIYYIL